ncbi:MAG: polyprenyl synthetase family protein [Pseudomonadota bacterium]
MDPTAQIESAIEAAVSGLDHADAPPKLRQAVRYALFPGGARLRPRLCLAVALAHRDRSNLDGITHDGDVATAAAAGAAIEFLHCGSLVHDDLPCFDDADVRRGKPALHLKFGEEIAVLAGDALIVGAFQAAARGAASSPDVIAGLIDILASATGMPFGIIAGQAWESENGIDLSRYHRAKTGALFVAAVEAGALVGRGDAASWRKLGSALGEAYQVADDLRDLAQSDADYGKTAGRDTALGRPSAAVELGVSAAVTKVRNLIDEGLDAVPECPGRGQLRAMIEVETRRFVPEKLAHLAA